MKLTDFLFPSKCVICGKIGNDLCNECNKRMKQNRYKNTLKDKCFVFKYEGLIRSLIIDYKFFDKSYLSKVFANFVFCDKTMCDFINSYDIIIPVPLHKKRRVERGYNQSELIAVEISKKLNKRIVKEDLIKVVNNKPQSTVKGTERIDNVKNAYVVKDKKVIVNKRVLLIDDVYTTGSTCRECERVLKEVGVKKVGVLTIAKD